MVDTVPGESGVPVVCHVAVDCVRGHAPAQTRRPNMAETTVPGLERAGSRRFATITIAAKVKKP